MAEKVMIGMSGGVDSSVTALLLKDAGYECLGVTLKLYTNEDLGLPQGHTCCSLDDVEDARSAAYRIGMPHYVFNASEAFERCVIENFVDVYEAGGTPNPCIECNKHLKFSYMLRKAREIGCEYIATGHYARVERREDGRYLLKKGLDESKDQTYFLYILTQDMLAHVKFPLGGYTKTQVRAIAEERGLLNARKHDSQDICFVPDGDYAGFIRRRTKRNYPAGDFVSESGAILGRHKGMIDYTVGQRRGLGVSGGKPLYVCCKDIERNTITLGGRESVQSRELTAYDINLIDRDAIEGELRCTAKIRSAHRGAACTVRQTGEDEISVTFDEPQWAVSTGQAVVLYDGDIVIGGGVIA